MGNEAVVLPSRGETISPGAVVYPFEFGDQPFKITMFDVEPGCETPVDEHRVEEIWVIQAGRGELIYEGGTLMVEPQQVVYFPPFKKHQIKNVGTGVLKILSIYW